MTREELVAVALELNECSCPKSETGAPVFGYAGWHFVLASSRYCWSVKRTDWTMTGDDVCEFCNCTREIRRKEAGRVEVLTPANPQCLYEGRPYAYELCPAYWSKVERRGTNGEIIRFQVDPANSSRLISTKSAPFVPADDDLISI